MANWRRGLGRASAPVLALALGMLAMLAGPAGLTTPARADDDAFGLAEVDPELPAKIKTWNADCLSCQARPA